MSTAHCWDISACRSSRTFLLISKPTSSSSPNEHDNSPLLLWRGGSLFRYVPKHLAYSDGSAFQDGTSEYPLRWGDDLEVARIGFELHQQFVLCHCFTRLPTPA